MAPHRQTPPKSGIGARKVDKSGLKAQQSLCTKPAAQNKAGCSKGVEARVAPPRSPAHFCSLAIPRACTHEQQAMRGGALCRQERVTRRPTRERHPRSQTIAGSSWCFSLPRGLSANLRKLRNLWNVFARLLNARLLQDWLNPLFIVFCRQADCLPCVCNQFGPIQR